MRQLDVVDERIENVGYNFDRHCVRLFLSTLLYFFNFIKTWVRTMFSALDELISSTPISPMALGVMSMFGAGCVVVARYFRQVRSHPTRTVVVAHTVSAIKASDLSPDPQLDAFARNLKSHIREMQLYFHPDKRQGNIDEYRAAFTEVNRLYDLYQEPSLAPKQKRTVLLELNQFHLEMQRVVVNKQLLQEKRKTNNALTQLLKAKRELIQCKEERKELYSRLDAATRELEHMTAEYVEQAHADVEAMQQLGLCRRTTSPIANEIGMPDTNNAATSSISARH